MISWEIINKMGLGEERVPFRMTIGRSPADSKTDVVEEGVIGDESTGGLVSVCVRQV